MSTVGRGGHHGWTLRSDQYRLVQWENAKTKKTTLVELYDHRNDPFETENIAQKQPQVVERLVAQLKTGKTSLQARNDSAAVNAIDDSKSGQIEIRQGDQPILRYNYRTVDPPAIALSKVSKGSLKYAQPRSNYIHPLYGPNGEELTKDWSTDHPHHRGIYWAWPEVMYNEELGDLHALQRVFARPTGKIELRQGDRFAEIAAESLWRWEDKTPIVRELTTIRAHETGEHGRFIDLQFEFTGLTEGVTIARRGTNAYGGLNIRLRPVPGVKLLHHADEAEASDESKSPGSKPRQAWQYATGVWSEAEKQTTFVVLEQADNPGYPGDYVEYANLPWFQPTFPREKTRHAIRKDQTLTLRYRLWILDGAPPSADEFRKQWNRYNASVGATSTSASPSLLPAK